MPTSPFATIFTNSLERRTSAVIVQKLPDSLAMDAFVV
jgi:hypothetical protein